MIINHPLLGPRDSEEFVYLGSTDLINRPTNWEEEASAEDFYQYQYISCLLYTSPSPRDATLSRMPSSA